MPAWVRPLQWVTGVVVAVYVAWTVPGVRPSPAFVVPLDGVLQGAAYLLVGALAVVAFVLRARSSLTWSLVAAAVVLRAAGFGVALSILSLDRALPTPSAADLAWGLSSLALIGAVSRRLHELTPRLPLLVVLDGIAGALVVLALGIGVLADPLDRLAAPGTGPRSSIVLNIGYPVLDIALLVAVVTMLATARRRLPPADLLLLGGAVAFAVVDVGYVLLLAEDAWRPGTLLAAVSLVATAGLGSTLWSPPTRQPPVVRRRLGELPTPPETPGIALTALLAVAAMLGLAVSAVRDTSTAAVLCYGAAGAVVIARGLLTLTGDRREAGLVLGAASDDLHRFQALVEASTDMIGIADVEGHVLYLNPAGRRLLGLDPDTDVTTISVSQLLQGEGAAAFRKRWPDVLAHGSWQGEATLAPLHGDAPIPVAASSFVIREPTSGRPFAVATIQRDIRDRLAAETARQELADERAELLTRLVQAQEDERARIAEDVHDDPVQALAAVDLRLGLLRRRLAEEAPALVEDVAVVQRSVTEANARLRHLLFDLESPAHQARLSDALAGAAAFVFDDTGVTWEVTGDPDLDLPEAERVTAYRIAKEALVNVRKHAAARHVVIDLARVGDGVVLSVRDDGRGIAPGDERDRPGHLGLRGMRDRAAMAGGRLEVCRPAEGGSEVRVWLPRSGRG